MSRPSRSVRASWSACQSKATQPLLSQHASAVAFDGRGVLMTGSSGSGKSSLAIDLIAIGGVLVADDQVVIEAREEGIWLTAPEALSGKIEARGMGILQVPSAPAWAALVIDMDKIETERLPPERAVSLAGVTLPLLHKVESQSFAAMLRAYLKGGRVA